MERFTDPTILETMSVGEKLLDSLLVMVLGMGVTFLVLVFLMFSIGVLRVLFQGKKATEDKARPKQPVAAPAKANTAGDDDELIAVINAAIAASQQEDIIAVIAGAIAAMETSGRRLKIQSIRRVTDPMPIWAQDGLMKNMRRI